MIRRIGVTLLAGVLMLWSPSAESRPVSDPDNPHNLSISATHGRTQATEGSEFGSDEICIFCHTPHSASPLGALWNRQDPTTTTTFPLYNAPLLIKNIAAAQYNTTADYPNGASKLCLSCHDGVTGVGTLLDRELTMNNETMPADYTIDLKFTHPVSFVFNATVQAALGAKASIPTDPDLRDSQERVQCTICHNPHDDRGEVLYNSAGVPPFWRLISADPADSYVDLCNKCHSSWGTLPSDHHTDAFPR